MRRGTQRWEQRRFYFVSFFAPRCSPPAQPLLNGHGMRSFVTEGVALGETLGRGCGAVSNDKVSRFYSTLECFKNYVLIAYLFTTHNFDCSFMLFRALCCLQSPRVFFFCFFFFQTERKLSNKWAVQQKLIVGHIMEMHRRPSENNHQRQKTDGLAGVGTGRGGLQGRAKWESRLPSARLGSARPGRGPLPAAALSEATPWATRPCLPTQPLIS